MSKRLAKATVDFAKLQKILPTDQQHIASNLMAKGYQYTLKVAALPAELPKIDFEAYKKQLSNPAVVAELEKGYTAFAVPAPKDSQNLLSKIDSLEKSEGQKLAAFVQKVQSDIAALQAEREKLTNLPPLENMTLELKAYYFPEKCGHLNAFEAYGEKDNLTTDFDLKLKA